MSRDLFVRELGIELLASACRLSVLRHDQLDEPLSIAPHHHDGVLQLDLVRGCRGEIFSGDRWLRFEGAIALASEPGMTHGYTLEPLDEQAAVYNIKIEPREPLRSLQTHPLPGFAGGPTDQLFDAAQRVMDGVGYDGATQIRAILALLGLVSDWPGGSVAQGRRAGEPGLDPVIERAVSAIESNLDEPLRLDDIASAVGLSGRQLARVFEREMGTSPHKYLTGRRLDRAKTLLLNSRGTIAQTAERLGFSGHATFTRWFSQHAGMTPTEFRSNPRVF